MIIVTSLQLIVEENSLNTYVERGKNYIKYLNTGLIAYYSLIK